MNKKNITVDGKKAKFEISEVWWSPSHPYKSSLSGNDTASLARAYQKQWTQPIGYVYALFEVAFDAINRAGSSKHDPILKALSETSLNTMVGKIEFDDQNLAHTPLVGGQWNVGKDHPWDLKIVSNNTAPEIDKQDNLFPIFYSE